MHHQTLPSRDRQQGAALLMAMVIVTLVATLSASMVWQQWRATQVEGAERVRAQAGWVLSGALDWARLILREDARSNNNTSDNLGEVWATPLAEARLSSFLAADGDNNATDEDMPEAFLSGKVDDATAKYNLFRLLTSDGKVDDKERAVLRRLCEFANLSPSLADGIAQSMHLARLAVVLTVADNPELLAELGGEQGRARAPLMPQTVDQLLWLGLDAATLEKLRPYVTLLPSDAVDVKVNVNTAPKEVIAAMVDGLDLARASRIVQARQRNPFKSTEDLKLVLGQKSPDWDFGRLDVKSEYFEVKGRLRYEDNVIEQRHLVQRISGSNDVVVRQQTRFSGLDTANGGGSPP